MSVEHMGLYIHVGHSSFEVIRRQGFALNRVKLELTVYFKHGVIVIWQMTERKNNNFELAMYNLYSKYL